jgi:GNAT superfamily N-acetyltransferase
VRQVFQENAPLLRLLGPEHEAELLATSLIEYENLPPGGDSALVCNTLVRSLDTGETLGVMELYRGYPSTTALYIGALFLRPTVQRMGYGAEVVRHLKQRAAAAGFDSLYAAIGLYNWPALRFWLAMGFTRATRVAGDEQCGADRFAVLELVHDLPTG